MVVLTGLENMEMGTNKEQKWMEEEVKKYKNTYNYLTWNPATGEVRIHVIMNITPPKTYKNKRDFLYQFRRSLGQHFVFRAGKLLVASDKIGGKIEKEWERENENWNRNLWLQNW